MLNEITESLKTSNRPVVKVIHDHNGTKLMAIGLQQGVELAEHTAQAKAKLIMVKGEVDFNTQTESLRFAPLDTYDIPLQVKHAVVALEDAIFLLLLSQ